MFKDKMISFESFAHFLILQIVMDGVTNLYMVKSKTSKSFLHSHYPYQMER